ncbi:hypothetical protein F441_15491 [Phytophthora nicotianae CJ01A1]|uniref:Transposase Tc1-like domain-containing protein n=2 Tax=Phytophthora nicotianae TaxID=4792 RepID=W2YNR9_PHYNI|nr:hypothetical protein F441_15492 [Phytophthora nicotianae CJ01A1]ETP08614.1 hypothetical protein F441_15491 [Phytophthora nicotianae CJ01A1]ETP36601.1 hypothetical protein F442_15512 [Phytophthora nicotianae P10297]
MSNLSEGACRAIILCLHDERVDKVLPRVAQTQVANDFGVDPSTASYLWGRHLEVLADDVLDDDWGNRMPGNVGRKPRDRSELVELIRAVPVEERQTETSLEAATGTSRRLLSSLKSNGVLQRHTSRIKPTLTPQNKMHRMQFALSRVNDDKMEFDPLMDVVHVDEKWFNEDKDRRSYLLLDGETVPVRHRKSKRFIQKTMFLAAVARPR